MTRAQAWGQLADGAIAAFEAAADADGQPPMAYGYLIRAIAMRSSWSDSRIGTPTTAGTLLGKLYSQRNPDGGWGLGYEFTGPGGVKNPATTTYGVTIADHVGIPLIEAHLAGLVPKTDIQTLVNVAMGLQRCTFPSGVAVAYSNQPADKVTTTNGLDVHNVNAGVAVFLQAAQDIGCAKTGLNILVEDIQRFESAAWYNGGARWWPYKGTGSLGDTDHTGYEADSFHGFLSDRISGLGYPIGAELAYRILSTGVGGDHDDKPSARIAWARLAGLPPSAGRMVGETTQWLVLADQYLDTITAFVAAGSNTRQKAQIACWAARAAARALQLEGA